MGGKETSEEAISIALMRSFEGPILGRTGGNINKVTQFEPRRENQVIMWLFMEWLRQISGQAETAIEQVFSYVLFLMARAM